MGNLRDTPFADIWNGEAYRAFRRQAASLEGLASFSSDCECRWCCYARDNYLVHRIAKWVGTLRMKEVR
jgi:MoaA/NifB/PqqE/SkfB family radical SAM enzyme